MAGLIKKLLFGAAIIATTAFMGCESPIVEPPVNYPPEYTSSPMTEVNEGSSASLYSSATDPEGDNLAHSLSLAPPWFSINQVTGLVSAAAPLVDADTSYDIIEGLSDGVNPIVTRAYTLTVKNIPESPIPVFSGKPSVSVESGNVPLEDLVSYSGSVTIGTVVKQEIGADLNKNGILEDTEIIATSTSAIKNKKIIFTQPGIYDIYGRSTDDKGNTGVSEPTVATISPIIANSDLTGTMTFPDTYNTGNSIDNKLTFCGTITNSSNQALTLDNKNKDSLKYTLVRQIVSGIGESIFSEKLEDNLVITLNRNGSFLKLEQKRDDKIYASFAHVDLTYNNIGPLGDFSWNNWVLDNHPCKTIQNKGNYSVITRVKYLKNSTENNFDYLSNPFAAN